MTLEQQLRAAAEAARFLGISVRRLDDLLGEGAIPTYRPTPGRVLIAEADLIAYLRARRAPRREARS